MTLNMEVKKNGLLQTQDGIWKLSLTIHPEDMPVALMQAPMGTRYALAMIPIEDEQSANNAQCSDSEFPNNSVVNEWLTTAESSSSNNSNNSVSKESLPTEKTEGDKIRIRAVMLCKDVQFHNFLGLTSNSGTEQGDLIARANICSTCNIDSRSELTTNIYAQDKFKELDRQFNAWKVEQQYADNLSR